MMTNYLKIIGLKNVGITKTKIYTGWYIKKWENNNYDYWNGSIIRHFECKKNNLKRIL